MPTWSEILTELKVESAQGNSAPFDFIRRKYLSELSKYTLIPQHYYKIFFLST